MLHGKNVVVCRGCVDAVKDQNNLNNIYAVVFGVLLIIAIIIGAAHASRMAAGFEGDGQKEALREARAAQVGEVSRRPSSFPRPRISPISHNPGSNDRRAASCARGVPRPPSAVIHPRRTRMPRRYPSSSDTDAMVARVAPAVLALLGDGVPRGRRAIVGELADRHPRDEVARTLMRLAVTGRLAETRGKYILAGTEEADRE